MNLWMSRGRLVQRIPIIRSGIQPVGGDARAAATHPRGWETWLISENDRSEGKMIATLTGMPLQVLKDDRAPDRIIVDVSHPDREETFTGIRCPLCTWRPSPSSRWFCNWIGTPEPFFQSCGTVWNTFATRGRCPGCSHQWQWTTCLRCGQSSLHEDWYEPEDGDR